MRRGWPRARLEQPPEGQSGEGQEDQESRCKLNRIDSQDDGDRFAGQPSDLGDERNVSHGDALASLVRIAQRSVASGGPVEYGRPAVRRKLRSSWRSAPAGLTMALMVAVAAVAGASASRGVDDRRLEDFLRGYVGASAPSTAAEAPTRYLAAWVDLKGDGGREALVYVSGAGWCGTGGCTLLILEPRGRDFRVVGEVSVTRLPIGVLPTASHGWRDITVAVGGGGIIDGYTAILPFNGRRYPDDPTLASARRLARHEKVSVVIGLTAKERPLSRGAPP